MLLLLWLLFCGTRTYLFSPDDWKIVFRFTTWNNCLEFFVSDGVNFKMFTNHFSLNVSLWCFLLHQILISCYYLLLFCCADNRLILTHQQTKHLKCDLRIQGTSKHEIPSKSQFWKFNPKSILSQPRIKKCIGFVYWAFEKKLSALPIVTNF